MSGKVLKFFLSLEFASLPLTRFFSLKRRIWRAMGIRVGDDPKISSSAKILSVGSVSIGDGTWVGHEFIVVGGDAKVDIGSRCDIGPRVMIATGTHEILLGQRRAAGPGYSLDVKIGDGVWTGAGAIILGGTSIGDCCIVAAGSVVKGNFSERNMIGGTPARVIRPLTD